MNNLFGPINEYSIAIIPPIEIIEIIACLKSELSLLIGPYSSQNSSAHISLSSFRTDLMGAQNIKIFLKNYTRDLKPFPMKFVSAASFPGTFHIAPDEPSDKLLKNFMRRFHESCPKFQANRYRTPHISIGRNLDTSKMRKANQMIRTVDIQFECDNISLRKFKKRQFEIENFFAFNY